MGFWKWTGRFSDMATVGPLLAPIVGIAGVGFVTAQLSQGVAWINQYGWFGWWCAFVLGALIALVGAYLFSLYKTRIVQAKAVERWSQVVDAINPLDDQFYRKRIKLADLAHPVTKRVMSKTFTQCELFGPGNLALVGVTANGVGFHQCEFVVVKDNAFIQNVVILDGCHIVGGTVWNVTLFMSQSEFNHMKANMPNIESLSHEGP